MPRFSLVVPTLGRADTFEHALATLVEQSYSDVEIVVQNNGNDPATRAVVERAEDARVRHHHTDEVVPMVENWERALSNATGDFVTFVGDDDGLLPDACQVAASVLDADDAEILSWQPFLYLWPRYWDEPRRNRLQAAVSFEFEIRSEMSRLLLQRFYDFEAHYSKLPMLYNSFVGRSLIDRVRDRYGRYFFGSLPDVTSGIVNAAFSESFLVSARALSVAGLSHHSTGHRWTRATTRLSPDELERDFSGLLSTGGDVAGSNLELLIANEMILMEEQVLREAAPVTFSDHGLVRAIAAAINESPSRYDETKALILALLRRFGHPEEEVAIPARVAHAPAPPDGVHVLGPYEVLFVLDGGRIGLRSISDAVRLAAQLVPPTAVMVRAEQLNARGGVPVVSTRTLAFAKGSDGIGGLISGWGEPESWGTWSVAPKSILRIQVPAGDESKAVRLGLRYRTIPFPSGTSRLVRCVIGNETLHEWEFSHDNSRGEIEIEVPGATGPGVVELSLVNLNPESPAELGIGPDQRRLGIGVETIRLLP